MAFGIVLVRKTNVNPCSRNGATPRIHSYLRRCSQTYIKLILHLMEYLLLFISRLKFATLMSFFVTFGAILSRKTNLLDKIIPVNRYS